MGILTTAYSVPFENFSKIKRYKKNLDFVLGLRSAKDESWKFEDYDFDKSITSTFEILKGCGYEHTGNILDVENFSYRKNGNYWNYEGYDVWFVSPLDVNRMAVELRGITFQMLKEKGLEAEVTDYYGKPILEKEYEYFVGDIENFRKFLQKAAELQNYLIFAAA